MAKKSSNGLFFGAGMCAAIALVTIIGVGFPEILVSLGETFTEVRYGEEKELNKKEEINSSKENSTSASDEIASIETLQVERTDIGKPIDTVPEVTTEASPEASAITVTEDGIIHSENEWLSGELDGKTLTIEFKKFKSLITADGKEQYFFSTKSEADSRIKASAETSGYSEDVVREAVKSAIITEYLDDKAPEVKNFQISGNKVTIKFKKAPTESFSFRGSQKFGWEGIYFEITA
ncbi:MAG: hypothetical protein IJ809_05990 [Clostridia bacterium]|nr:hypothetical protein [Clostridia bacterium]